MDEDGYAIPERDGVVRYFVQEGGEYYWGDTKEELGKARDIPEDRWEDKILSFSFVSGTIYDNPIMMEINPSYLAFLEGLNEVDKAQLLYGCWDARPKGANYFEREWLDVVDKIPVGVSCRAYDFGASERSQVNKNPDPTVSIMLIKDKEGYYTLAGCYHKDFYDEVLEIEGHVCKRVGERDTLMLKQAEYDGTEVPIIAPQDPAAAGKAVWENQAKFFSENGFLFKKDPCPINKNKLTKFLPFATAAENKLVKIAKHTFSPKTYEYILKQLEAFDGERSTTTRSDDFADCIATAYNYLSKQRVIKPFTPPQISAPTKLSQYRG